MLMVWVEESPPAKAGDWAISEAAALAALAATRASLSLEFTFFLGGGFREADSTGNGAQQGEC